jgi:hypothetical protein
VPKSRRETVRLSILSDRGAKLNRAVIRAFGSEKSLSTRQIYHKIIQNRELRKTSYSTVNKRVRNLEQSGYLRKASTKPRPGGLTNYYELRPKTYLAMFFDSNPIEHLLEDISDESALAILGVLMGTSLKLKD